jgi:AbrB family looped-hinge helix DNA binding protein
LRRTILTFPALCPIINCGNSTLWRKAMDNRPLTRVVRPLRRGQLTIPAEFRRRLGIADDTLLQLTLQEGKIEITPVVATPAAEMAWARELYSMFAPVRQEAQELEEAEIDALIDEVVDEVRSQDHD